MNNDEGKPWVTEEQIAGHFQDLGRPADATVNGIESTTAQGKTEFFEQLTKHLADRQSGLGWKDAWTLRLGDLGEKNRLPRGFSVDCKTKTLRDREAAACVLQSR